MTTKTPAAYGHRGRFSRSTSTTSTSPPCTPSTSLNTHFCFADSPSRGVLAGEYDTVRDLMTWGVYYDVIKRRGRYFDFADRTWDLKDAIIDSLREELDLRDEVAAAVLKAAFHPEPQQVAA